MAASVDDRQIGIGRLIATNPSDSRSREFLLLKAGATVGSDESNDFVIRDSSVSRRHALITFQNNLFKLRDLGSTNGSFVNNARVDGWREFGRGDKIRFGAANFIFLRSSAAPIAQQPVSGAQPRRRLTRTRRRRATRKLGERSRLTFSGARPDFWLARRKTIVGSDPASQLVLVDETVAERHAVIKRRLRGYWLRDLRSANGTFVNDRRISVRRRLSRGDEIRFGSVRAVFLQSPTTRELNRRVAPRTLIAALLGALIVGFIATQNHIVSSLSESVARLSRSKAAISARLAGEEARSRNVLEDLKSQSNQPAWLRRVNYYRGLADLSLVTENPSLSHADQLHSRFLVKYQLKNHAGYFGHSEDPNDPYFTAIGLAAAKNSDVAGPSQNPTSDEQAVDEWVMGAFHRLNIINPELQGVGYGTYQEGGLQAQALYLLIPPSSPHTFSTAVEFPSDRSAVPLSMFSGQNEWPNPLTSCPGYAEPTGLAITLQLGPWIPVAVTDHSFKHDGIALDHCIFDSDTYVNPDPPTQQWARQVLKGTGAVVLIPRAPLASGEHYAVSITANGAPYAWSFIIQ